MLNWYKTFKIAQELGYNDSDEYWKKQSRPKNRDDNYFEIGHNGFFNKEESESNPQDALWVFDKGQFNASSLAEWMEVGGTLAGFSHHEIFGNERAQFKGRYDAGKNLISYHNRSSIGSEGRVPSLLVRQLERRWPNAQIIDFSMKRSRIG